MKTLPANSITKLHKNAALSFETYCILKMIPREVMQIWMHQEVKEVQESPGAEKSDEVSSHSKHCKSIW